MTGATKLTWFKQASRSRKIGTRLRLGFSLMTALMVVLVMACGYLLWQQDQRFGTVLDNSVPHLTKLQSIGSEVDALNLAARDALLASDESASTAALARIEQGRSTVGQQIEGLQARLNLGNEQSKKLAEQLGTHSSGILVTLVKFSRLHKAHRTEQARALFGNDLQGKMLALSDTIKKAQELQLEGLVLERNASRQHLHSAMGMGVLILLGAVGLSATLAWWLSRSITRPIQQAVEVARNVANGDLSTQVTIDRDDEIGQLLNAMVTMQQRLASLVSGILQTVSNIESTSTEIAEGNEDLSDRTDQASGTLQSTSVAMGQLAGAFHQSAESAKTANELVTNTSQGVARSGQVVAQVVTNMQDISASSAKIADILSVIDSIAFQTNILALNAAVEAARAGEQGRGFAVVAGEVRALAQRSASAAKEIKTLITASLEKVSVGSQLVTEAGRTMGDLVRQVAQVSQLIHSITVVSEQQNIGVDQVNASVNELDEATQRNASLVQQTSQAASTLKTETMRLAQAVGVFRLA
jgi:methyl-accepting chemotaxis protein